MIIVMSSDITCFDFVNMLYTRLGINEMWYYFINMHNGWSIMLEEICTTYEAVLLIP